MRQIRKIFALKLEPAGELGQSSSSRFNRVAISIATKQLSTR
jgi:hypothetical protein